MTHDDPANDPKPTEPVTQEDVQTPADTPDAREKRLTVPPLDLKPGDGVDALAKALANVVVAVAENLAYLRAEARARFDLESVNGYAIRKLSERHDQAVAEGAARHVALEARVDALAGRRWQRIVSIRTSKLRLAAFATFCLLVCTLFVFATIVVACHR